MPRPGTERQWLLLADRILEKEKQDEKQKLVESRPCVHPPQCVVGGRNQYGSWQRCLRCRTKISYTPARQRVDTVKGKEVTYVTVKGYPETKKAAKALGDMEKASRATSSQDPPESNLRDSLMESNQQLLVGMTSVLSQAMTPMVAGQQALMELTQQSLASQAIMMQTVQQSQSSLGETMSQIAQQMKRHQDEEEWDQVPEG